ncbi:MAG: WD40 repeat domain-containing protein [Cyanobacteria bacterium P01_D01_bin.105]
MSNLGPTLSPTPEAEPARFPSLASLRAAHTDLLKRHREQGNEPAVLVEIEQFMHQGHATGAVLDNEDDRWTAQGLLDYWSSVLYRAGQVEPPDATLVDFDPALAPDLDDTLCPYLGLEAFRAENEHLFFGRQRLLDKLLKHLESHRLLVVIGSSGSGKSSVVLGGVLPKLVAGALPGSRDWIYYAPLVPGSNPLAALARRLKPARATADWVTQQVKAFQADPFHLLQLVTPNDAQASQPVVLFIDQFEEVFTLCRDEALREALVQNLINFVQAEDRANRLILTMRTDFESQLVRLPGLLELFEESHVRTTALEATELREAIAQPAALVGLKLEEGLIDALLSDVLGEPAALPLLQFTLLKLWEHRERNRVTWEAYRRLGGGRLALAKSADEFYEGLIPEEQVTMRRILLRMVRPGEGLEVTSRRVPQSELYAAGEAGDRVNRVLEKLILVRLVRLTEGELPDDAQVEVAHEALIRNWPRLADWLEDERASLRQRLRLTAAAEQWKSKKRDSSTLLRGILLQEARTYDDLNDLERDFIRASIRAEKRGRNTFLLVAAAVTLSLSATTIFALMQTRRVLRLQTATAEINRDSLQAIDWINTGRGASGMALAIKTLQRSISYPETQSIVYQALITGVQNAREQNQLYGHKYSVRSIAYSPNSQYIASGSVDNTLKIWNAKTGQLIRTIIVSNDPENWVYAVAFSPDSQKIVTAGEDSIIRIWDLTSGKQMGQALTGHTGPVRSVLFSPDGKKIVSGGDDKAIRIWETESGETLLENIHWGAVLAVAFSPNGQVVASGSTDNTIRLWNANTGELIGEPMRGHQGSIFSLAFSADGARLVSGSSDRTLKLWNMQTRKQIGESLRGHQDKVYAVSFSPDDRYIISAGADRSIRLWNAKNGKPSGQILDAHNDLIWSLDVNADSHQFVSSSSDKTIRLWDIRADVPTGQPLTSNHESSILSMALSSDDAYLVTADESGQLNLWDMESQQQRVISLGSHDGPVYSVMVSPNNQQIVSVGVDGTLRIWGIDEQSEIAKSEGHNGAAIYSAAFSPDGKQIVSGGRDNNLQLWDADSNKSFGPPMPGHKDWVYAVAFSPDGKYVVSGSRDDTLVLWDVQTRQLIRVLEGHTDDVWSVAFSPDGKKIASGSKDQTIIIWDSQTGEQISQLPGHNNTVWSVQFSPNNNNLLASSGYDGTVRLWDINQTKQIGLPLEGHTGSVWSVNFTSEGDQIFSAGADLTLRRWPTDLQMWPNIGCDRLQHHPLLTAPETILQDEQSLTIARDAQAACNARPWQQSTLPAPNSSWQAQTLQWLAQLW